MNVISPFKCKRDHHPFKVLIYTDVHLYVYMYTYIHVYINIYIYKYRCIM